MRLVIVESPYAGDVARNEAFARAAMADCLARGEAPFASHLLYTQHGVLDDTVPHERELGIGAGLTWGSRADATVVYDNFGMSSGMAAGVEAARQAGREVEYRTLPGWDSEEAVTAAMVTCRMRHGEPYDFAWCVTHDKTFPFGEECPFYGHEMWEVFAQEADKQRERAVLAEMDVERLQGELAERGEVAGALRREASMLRHPSMPKVDNMAAAAHLEARAVRYGQRDWTVGRHRPEQEDPRHE